MDLRLTFISLSGSNSCIFIKLLKIILVIDSFPLMHFPLYAVNSCVCVRVCVCVSKQGQQLLWWNTRSDSESVFMTDIMLQHSWNHLNICRQLQVQSKLYKYHKTYFFFLLSIKVYFLYTFRRFSRFVELHTDQLLVMWPSLKTETGKYRNHFTSVFSTFKHCISNQLTFKHCIFNQLTFKHCTSNQFMSFHIYMQCRDSLTFFVSWSSLT